MALRQRMAGASYRFYDRWRHKAAFEAAEQPCTATDFSGCEGQKYAVLVTFRKDGTAVPTPVKVFPSDPRGKPLAPGVEGTARVLETETEAERDYLEVTPASTT